MESADSLEIIANLWYIHDEQGTIYSLRGRLYLASGSDTEKLAMLRGYADVDYLIAKPFPIPERLHTTFVLGGEHRKLAVTNRDSLPLLGGEMVLFEEVLQELERQLPAQTPFKSVKVHWCASRRCWEPMMARLNHLSQNALGYRKCIPRQSEGEHQTNEARMLPPWRLDPEKR